MLTLRLCKDEELEAFKRFEDEHHEMGKTHFRGDTMWLIAEEDVHAVALMVWGSGSYRLKERDEYVGWTPALRASRQKLVVCNRRFTLLVSAGTRPNLASQILGLAVRELPGLWLERQNETAQDIVARGGEYLLQAKNNRKAVLAAARSSAAAAEASGTGEKTTRPTAATAASNPGLPSSARPTAMP